jgi:hypothetical protein
VLQNILYFFVLVGSLFGAGYVGSLIAEHQAKKLEDRIAPPWSWWDREVLISNTGFYCGAAGALVWAAAAWLAGIIRFTL